jgi:hypothetical protein
LIGKAIYERVAYSDGQERPAILDTCEAANVIGPHFGRYVASWS